ncbi:MAG: type II 3-dehydroquinate dehydratase [Gammaproteobacteria bacterium]|jgi:3-dehydroquinate dehydratase-2|nr:type II 3-dehydroquinate dehydratase [Gammaproteobacteria bacterium]
MSKIRLLNGPNLNLLGSREPEVYGYTTLDDIVADATSYASSLGHELSHLQSNAEHALIDGIHAAKTDGVEFIVINPGAFTHSSIALRDAFLGVSIPFIEIHLSNVFAREEFRAHSYLSDVAVGLISGLGANGYRLAINAADQQLKS